MKKEIIATRYFTKENKRVYWLYNIIENWKKIDIVEREIFFQNKIPFITYKNEWVKVIKED